MLCAAAWESRASARAFTGQSPKGGDFAWPLVKFPDVFPDISFRDERGPHASFGRPLAPLSSGVLLYVIWEYKRTPYRLIWGCENRKELPIDFFGCVGASRRREASCGAWGARGGASAGPQESGDEALEGGDVRVLDSSK